MSHYSLKCVGGYHRPPALALTSMCAAGTPVLLVPEPTNAFDSNAIKVMLDAANIPVDQFEEQGDMLAGFGHDKESVMAGSPWHLGYIPRTDAAWLVRHVPQAGLVATLQFDHEAKPRVELDVDTTPKLPADGGPEKVLVPR